MSICACKENKKENIGLPPFSRTQAFLSTATHPTGCPPHCVGGWPSYRVPFYGGSKSQLHRLALPLFRGVRLWVCPVVDLHQLFDRNVRVDFGRRESRVAEKLLNGAKVRAPREHVRSERMSK